MRLEYLNNIRNVDEIFRFSGTDVGIFDVSSPTLYIDKEDKKLDIAS